MAEFNLQGFLNAPAEIEKSRKVRYETAAAVHAEIITAAKSAQENLYQMAMGFKKMRDEKLYLQLGYQNFEEYCENNVGFSRKQVYHYISVVENLPKEFVTSRLQVGVNKLYLISRLAEEERSEIVETVDLESTTVKDLKAEIKKLKGSLQSEQDKTKSVVARYDERIAGIVENNKARVDKLEKQLEEFKENDESKALKERIEELNLQIKELEERPVDVAVQDNTEELQKQLENQKAAYEIKINNKEQKIVELKNKLTELESKSNKSIDTSEYEFIYLLNTAKEAIHKAVMLADSSERTDKIKEFLKTVNDYLKHYY